MKTIIFTFIKQLLVKVIKSDMWHGVKRYKKRGGAPLTVIDVGAAKGLWTKKCMDFFPNAKYIMLEPLPQNKEALDAMVKNYPQGNVNYIQAVAGETVGNITFCISDDLDGSGVYGPEQGANFVELPAVSIDSVATKGNYNGPFVIKLDTHGYEIPILEGSPETLKRTDLLIIEVYGFNVSPTALTFWEICAYLDKKGFRLVDIVDIMRRPNDGAFWQADAFFIPKSSKLFSINEYQ